MNSAAVPTVKPLEAPSAAAPYPPIIYTRITAPERLWISTRLVALAMSVACLTLLITAAWLPPSSAGYGTHTGLGLQPCAFRLRTGLPCPGCGMTTSFSYFVRGNLAASFYVQPMGTVLAILAAGMFWVGLYVAITGRPVHRLLRLIPSGYYVMPLLGFGLLAWCWKIFLTLRGLDGWRY